MPTCLHTLRALTCSLLCWLALPAGANPADSTFAVVLDNDWFVGTDRRYTNGLRLAWLAPAAETGSEGDAGASVSGWLAGQLSWLPFASAADLQHSAALMLTQVIVTPDDIQATEPLPEQAPYLGYLSGEITLYGWNDERYHGLGLAVGVVGPGSGAEHTQRLVHRLFGATEPQGWDNQVERQHTAALHYTLGRRLWRQPLGQTLQTDLSVNGGVRLGTPDTSFSTSLVWRLGRALPRSFSVFFSDVGGEAALLGLNQSPADSGWHVHAGVAATAIAWNSLERAIRDSHDLRPRHSIGSLVLGAGLYRGRLHAGLSLQTDTSPLHADRAPITYGSAYLFWQNRR